MSESSDDIDAEFFMLGCILSPEFRATMDEEERKTGRPNIVYAVAVEKSGDSSVIERLIKWLHDNQKAAAARSIIPPAAEAGGDHLG